MINGIGAQFEIGAVVTLTTSAETSDGHTYAAGESGELVAQGQGEDKTILALFAGRPALCCTPGDDCVIGSHAIA